MENEIEKMCPVLNIILNVKTNRVMQEVGESKEFSDACNFKTKLREDLKSTRR